jgi:hypothetical protein
MRSSHNDILFQCAGCGRNGQHSQEPDIRIAIQTLETQRSASYEALSYTWGDTEHISEIFIHLPHIFLSNHKFNITENLFSALQHIRDLSMMFSYGLMRSVLIKRIIQRRVTKLGR